MIHEIHHHCGVGIIESEKTQEFLFQVYDNTFPTVIYRGRINLIGGNHNPNDLSPKYLFEREIKEEFSITEKEEGWDSTLTDVVGEGSGPEKITKFASQSDMASIKDAVLQCQPFKDFVLNIPSIQNKPIYDVIYSVFSSTIPQDVFELARKNILEEKSIKNEGLATIKTIEEIVAGNPLPVAGTGIALEHYLAHKYGFHVKIPNPEGINSMVIGMPRASFKDYLNEFHYSKAVKSINYLTLFTL